MNKARREQVEKAYFHIEQAQALIQEAQAGEQEAFDNLPENLQQSERGQEWAQAADTLAAVASSLDDAFTELGAIAL